MASISVRPLSSRVLVKWLEPEEVTPGGIVLPDTAKEKPKRGTVLSVGPGRFLDTGVRQPPEVEEGDAVLFGSYAGTKVEVNGEELVIMDESEILAVCE